MQPFLQNFSLIISLDLWLVRATLSSPGSYTSPVVPWHSTPWKMVLCSSHLECTFVSYWDFDSCADLRHLWLRGDPVCPQAPVKVTCPLKDHHVFSLIQSLCTMYAFLKSFCQPLLLLKQEILHFAIFNHSIFASVRTLKKLKKDPTEFQPKAWKSDICLLKRT